MTSATLTLPWPPSLNALFSDGRKRRTISKRYEQWIALASGELMIQRPKRHTGPVRATLMLSPPDNRERDADNYAKAPMDLLVKAGVIEGDSRRYVRSILLAWSDATPAKPGCVTVHLEAA